MRRLMATMGGEAVAHELVDATITLGRSPENMIVFDDPSVSSRHAQLQLVGEDYQLQDLDSTNGTRVNERVISTVTLRAGDRLRFGKVEGHFECDRPSQAQPLPVLAEIDAKPA